MMIFDVRGVELRWWRHLFGTLGFGSTWEYCETRVAVEIDVYLPSFLTIGIATRGQGIIRIQSACQLDIGENRQTWMPPRDEH
jgi:hypothetical protein